MKLNDSKPNVETSGDLEEQFFSIQDQGMIFDILRNKMYSNPILAICREISCNARDAHREIGNNTPVQITLPNNLEPTYKIKDFGPGISPERMSNIFIKYTASTKRNDNVQTGGFGLGAKTPFSYSDTFSIITNVNGTQYNYSCFIDETKVGKLALLSEMPTTEVNGTTIIIPVKQTDFNYFRDYTEQATRHWEVRPTIKGGIIQWKDIIVTLKGTNWIIGSCSDPNRGYYDSREVKLIIDGVEYPLDITNLRKYADSKVIDACRGSVYLYFGVGELSLSASREQVYLDNATQAKIATRLRELEKDLQKNVSDKIEKFPNYWDANVFYRKELNTMFANLAFLGKISWHGYDLHDLHLNTNCDVFSFVKGSFTVRGNDPNKVKRSRGRSIVFSEKSKLILNDLTIKEPTPKHVKKAFELDTSLSCVQVVCPNDKVTVQILNDTLHFDQMDYLLLSDLTKASGRTYKPSANRLLVFKFEQALFRLVSYSSIEEDDNQPKILCRLSKDTYGSCNRMVTLSNGKALSSDSLFALLKKFPNTSIYGVDISADQSRIDEDFEDFIDIEEFIKENITENPNIDFIKLKYVHEQRYHINERMLRLYKTFTDGIVNSQSLFLKKLEIHNCIQEISENEIYLLHIYENFKGHITEKEIKDWVNNHKDYDLMDIDLKCAKKYPLIDHINQYHIEQIAEHIINYINLIDR